MEVLTCKLCKKKNVPLKMSNLFIDDEYEVYGVCSACILKTPPNKLFPSGPKPWSERFYRDLRQTPRSEWASLLVLALMMSFMLWLFIGIGGV